MFVEAVTVKRDIDDIDVIWGPLFKESLIEMEKIETMAILYIL